MNFEDLKVKKIAVLGLGVNNQKLAEYFKARGINFQTFADWKDPDELVGKIDDFDMVFRTPGLPYLSKAIQQAKSKGIEVSSQTKLFFDLCPAPIIGVTGTKGKGTTATLIARILEAAASRQARDSKVYLAGNIGSDPFEFIDSIGKDDLVVLELSSFQLQDVHKSPHIAVVLKTASEHLDHHKTTEEYQDAKKNIVRFQSAADFAILNYDSEIVRDFASFTPAKIYWASTEQNVKPGCFVTSGLSPHVRLRRIGGDEEGVEIMLVSDVQLLGRFNLENITAAVAAVSAAGVNDAAIIRQTVKDFKGLPHRLEFVAEKNGVKYYNDSFSTTPETAIAAISAFDAPLILIVGGSEKNSDYSKLAEKIADSKVKALIPIGITGPKIAELARKAGYQGKITDNHPKDMEEIIGAANDCAEAGDVVLLSPSSASFDMFADYKHRGELFKKFAQQLPV